MLKRGKLFSLDFPLGVRERLYIDPSSFQTIMYPPPVIYVGFVYIEDETVLESFSINKIQHLKFSTYSPRLVSLIAAHKIIYFMLFQYLHMYSLKPDCQIVSFKA